MVISHEINDEISGRPGGEAVLSEREALTGAPIRRVLHFGQQVQGDTLTSIPQRLRTGPGSPSGRLVGAVLLPVAHRAWISLSRRGRWPWQTTVRTIPLSEAQASEPPQDAVALRDGLRVECHDGYIGRLEGLTVDAVSGRVLDLLVRVRGDVLAEVQSPSSPFTKLLPLAGQVVLVPPTWVTTVAKEHEKDHEKGREKGKEVSVFSSGEPIVHLDATPEQIGSAMVIRRDGDVSADIWRIWENNPAIAPYLDRIEPVVHDGDVTLRGVVPSPRHKATAEQDVWHVPGVFSVVNSLRVGA